MSRQDRNKDWVAIILSVALAVAFITVTCAILFASASREPTRLSENGTQILSAVFGGIIGILGSYLGYRSASTSSSKKREKEEGRLNDPQDETFGEDG